MRKKSKIRCGGMTYLISFVLMVGLVLTNISIAAEPGLVGWWKFDDGSGGIAKDSSGSGNDGTLNGNPRWVDGKIGGALEFNGSISFVRAPHIPLNSRTFTIMMWVNPVLYTSEQVVFSQTQSRSTNLSMHFRLGGQGGGNVPAYGIRMGFYANDLDTPANIIVQNNWYHITFWYNFENQTRRIYVNGAKVAEGAAGPFLGTSGNTVIGSWDGTGQWFMGIIDDVRIYYRALTEEEIKQAMQGIPPGVASNPSPADEATDVPRDVTLSWTPGEFAPPVNGHKVFFSENFTDVNDGIGGIAQSANSYTPPQVLDFDKTYYWRVDEVNGPPDFTVYKGEVWQFTVEPFAYPIAGANITATASSQFSANIGPQNTINGSGLAANDLHSTRDADTWLSSMTGVQPTWIQYEFGRVYKLHQMWVWNYNASIEPALGFGVKNATIEYSTDGANWTTLGTTHQFARAPGTPGYAHNTTVDFGGVPAKHVKITANSNWGGILPQYGLSEVRFFYIPVSAREPDPVSGAIDINVDNVTVSWRAGREAAKHNVYLSDSNQAVIDGTAPVTTVSQTSYGPLSFDLGKTYYWRVDEVNEAETPATWQGDIWNFSAQEYLVVDDFEDYNDFDPDRIFDTWIDGWNVPANGSQVGYAAPPFAERTIVHSGKQSMPLSYDNTAGATYSEAERTFAAPQNWTEHGVKTLSLWFAGAASNVAGQLYVKVNGFKVTYDGDASNLTRGGWQPWNINLASFSVNRQSVTKLSIGIDGNGAKGTLYLDDIRLYPLREP